MILNWENVPKEGMMYALYRSRMVYEPYTVEKLRTYHFEEEDMLELHLFDKEREYRVIRSSWKGLFDYGVISDSTEQYVDTYEETIYVTGGDADRQDSFNDKNKITVVNYISYDRDDILRINNYRLKEMEA